MKGSEVFPDAVRPPTLVRTHIVTPRLLHNTDEEIAADLAQKIIAENKPRILSFFNAAIANYDLSGQGYQFRRIEFPQGEVTTTFIGDQPIVDITVYPEFPVVEEEDEFTEDVKMGVFMRVGYHWDSKYSFVMIIDGEPYPKSGNYMIVDAAPPSEPVVSSTYLFKYIDVTEPLKEEEEGIISYGGFKYSAEQDPERENKVGTTKNGVVFIDLSKFFSRGRARAADVEFRFFKDYAEPSVKTGETITYTIGSMTFYWTPTRGEYWWYVNEDGRWCFGYYGGKEPNSGWARDVDYIFNGDWYYEVTWQLKVEPYPVTVTTGPQPYASSWELPPPSRVGGYSLAEIQGYFGVSHSYANSAPSGNFAQTGGNSGPTDWYATYDYWNGGPTSFIPTVTDVMTPRGLGSFQVEFHPDWVGAEIGYLTPEFTGGGESVDIGYFTSKVEWWYGEWTDEQFNSYLFSVYMPADKTGLIETRKFKIPAKYFDKEYVKRQRRKYA
tara:strand:+ start:3256 stop:4740 length:1485 start_codon:yes stop_codon:yes gene_type:complete